MKTAMQELLEWHRKSMRSYSETNKMIEAFIEKEKEQIINAHLEGWSDAYDYLKDDFSAPRQAKDYYNETYNQNNNNERNNTDTDRVY